MNLTKSTRILLNLKQKNHNGQTYSLFNSENLINDRQYLEEFLISNLKAVSNMVFSEDKNKLAKHILKTYSRITAVRIDLVDENTQPISKIVQDMKSKHNGQIDKNGAVTLNTSYDGIVLFLPVLKEEINNNINGINSYDGTHKALHELVHALSARKKVVYFERDGKQHKRTEYLTGIREMGQEQGIFDDINEGMTEYFTQKILKKRGIPYEELYPWRVKLVDAIMHKFEAKERRKMFTQYITGESDLIIETFKSLENEKGENLWNFLDKNYQQKRRGVSGATLDSVSSQQSQEVQDRIKASLQEDEIVYNEIVTALNSFENVKTAQNGSIM